MKDSLKKHTDIGISEDLKSRVGQANDQAYSVLRAFLKNQPTFGCDEAEEMWSDFLRKFSNLSESYMQDFLHNDIVSQDLQTKHRRESLKKSLETSFDRVESTISYLHGQCRDARLTYLMAERRQVTQALNEIFKSNLKSSSGLESSI